MKIALWIVQALVALAFLGAGSMKLFTPYEDIAAQMAWAADAPAWLVRFIGVAEVAGALGLILPPLTKIKPWLTPLAALGLTVVMVLAVGTHVVRGEYGDMVGSVVLLVLSALVWRGRSGKAKA